MRDIMRIKAKHGIYALSLTSALLLAAVFAGFVSGTNVETHFRDLRTTSNADSLNWGGYAVASSFSAPTASVTEVNASWTVQSAANSKHATYSSQWVGIGGYFDNGTSYPFNDQTLIQTGTESDYSRGAQYYAWYELLPGSETVITSMNVKPGDQIVANISLIATASNSLGEWKIVINDTSHPNDAYSTVVYYNSSELSGEYIEERPMLCSLFMCRLTNLANFGKAYFGTDYTHLPASDYATINGAHADIGALDHQNLTMVTTTGRVLASPSALTTDGTSFTMTYGSSGGSSGGHKSHSPKSFSILPAVKVH